MRIRSAASKAAARVFRKSGKIIGNDAVHQGQAAPFGHLGRGQVGIGIPHLARAGFFVQGDDLIPGGNNGHPGFLVSRQAGNAQGGQEADLLGAEAAAGGKEGLAPGHVLPGGEDIFPGGHGPAHLQGAVRVLGGVFEHHHRVGARGAAWRRWAPAGFRRRPRPGRGPAPMGTSPLISRYWGAPTPAPKVSWARTA